MAATASLALAFAASAAPIASMTLWKSATSDDVVYAVFPSVNDPFGKCFSVPAMSARMRAKAVALDGLVGVPDMVPFLLSEGALGAVGPRLSAFFFLPSSG